MSGVWQLVKRFQNTNKQECKQYILDHFPSPFQGYDGGSAFKTIKHANGKSTHTLKFYTLLQCEDVDAFLEYCHTQMHKKVTDATIPVDLVFDVRRLTWKNLISLYSRWSSTQIFAGVSMYVSLPNKISSIHILSTNDSLLQVFVAMIVKACFTEKMKKHTSISS